MMSTIWVVPTTAISFCLGSRATISWEWRLATLLRFSASAGLLVLTDTDSQTATSARIPLSANTVPIPPLPACLYLTLRLAESYHEKLRHPIRVFAAPGPVDTTDTLLGLSFPKWDVSRAESSWASSGSPGISSILTVPETPSTTTTASPEALPVISRASKPENFR